MSKTVLVKLLVDVVGPLALFYGLRAAGVSQWWALALGGVPPLVLAAYELATRRKLDGLAVFTLSVIGLSIAVSFLAGSTRFLLAKDGWLTALGGLWMLVTVFTTPMYFLIVRSVTKGARHDRVESAWRDSANFRHVMRVATAIWGVGLVLDAVVRVVLAYTLPIDRVPLVNGLQYVVVFVVLEISSQIYVRRRGGRDLRPEEVPA